MNQLKVFLIGLIAVWCIFGLAMGKPNPEEAGGGCDKDGYYADPSACSKYYRCNSGKRFDFECDEGTYYNPISWNCDWPENVQCGK